MHLSTLAPNSLVHRPVVILHNTLSVWPVVLIDISSIPPVFSILILRLEILNSPPLVILGRRDTSRAFRPGIVENATCPIRRLATGHFLLAATALSSTIGTRIMNDFEPSHHLLLRQLHRGMAATIPIGIKGQGSIPAARRRLPPRGGGTNRTRRFDGTRSQGTTGLARRLGTDTHAIVVESYRLALFACGAYAYHLPSGAEDAFLGHLDVGVKDAASVFVVLAVGRATFDFFGERGGFRQCGRFAGGTGFDGAVVIVFVFHALLILPRLPPPGHRTSSWRRGSSLSRRLLVPMNTALANFAPTETRTLPTLVLLLLAGRTSALEFLIHQFPLFVLDGLCKLNFGMEETESVFVKGGSLKRSTGRGRLDGSHCGGFGGFGVAGDCGRLALGSHVVGWCYFAHWIGG
eukprot:CCRYP_016733-RA/>CCRYP_016733-RA protein AED:0.09 eAED:0.45 QI:0/0/0.5/1/0/0/2/803/405